MNIRRCLLGTSRVRFQSQTTLSRVHHSLQKESFSTRSAGSFSYHINFTGFSSKQESNPLDTKLHINYATNINSSGDMFKLHFPYAVTSGNSHSSIHLRLQYFLFARSFHKNVGAQEMKKHPTTLNKLPPGNLKPESEKEAHNASGRFQKLKLLWKQYGYVALGTYVSAYVGMLLFTYGLASAGVIPAGDAVKFIEWAGLDISDLSRGYVTPENIENYGPQAGRVFTAWLLTKISEPLRIIFTLSVTPAISRRLGYAPPKVNINVDEQNQTQ